MILPFLSSRDKHGQRTHAREAKQQIDYKRRSKAVKALAFKCLALIFDSGGETCCDVRELRQMPGTVSLGNSSSQSDFENAVGRMDRENGLNGTADEKRRQQSRTGHAGAVNKQLISPIAADNQQAEVALVGPETDSTAIPSRALDGSPLVLQVHEIPGAVIEA